MVTIKELHAFTFLMHIFVDESHGWANYAATNSVTPQHLLAETQARRAKAKKPPLWIFDIDSTLLCLATRFQHIFFDYLRFECKQQIPAVYWSVASALSPSTHRYGIGPALEPLMIQQRIPNAAQIAATLAQAMFPFWYQAFFSERYLDKDFAYPDAAAFVSQIHALGVQVCYLTGRHANTMTRGTRESLRRLDFPLDDDQSFLTMKTDLEESDVNYKHRYLSYLNERYEVLGFMDNEPENILAQIRINRAALPVWFHSISSERIPRLTKSEAPHLCVLRSFANQ